MRPKHTPGPWEFVPSIGEDNPRVLSKHVTRFGNFYVATCNLDEDARLIAAAPELLEIAKAYRNLLRTMAQTDGEVATYAHIESIVAKVEGRD